ncbi:single-stranded DNA-binding protein [Sinorhizobium meliloti]|nr:single-stranded DNA-binding protein [Sinorhizobium meliloti]
MAGSVNKVILIGNVGADPEIRRTQDGRPIANLRIATSETWRDRNSGERREKTEWHTVVVFNEGLCKVVEQYVKKGAKLYIEGQLQTRKWQDQTGNDRYSTEVVLQGFNSTLTMLDGRGGEGAAQVAAAATTAVAATRNTISRGPPRAAPGRAVNRTSRTRAATSRAISTTTFRSDRLRQPVRDHPARFVAGRSRCAFRPETPNARRPRRIERRVPQG